MSRETLEADCNSIIQKIEANKENPDELFWEKVTEQAKLTHARATKEGPDDLANLAWFILRSAETIGGFVNAFSEMKAGSYYEAWCTLERVEINAMSLRKNQFLALDKFGLDKVENLTASFQGLFPYKIFMSPEFLHKHVECSVCGDVLSPWSDCEHEKGRVYRGVECIHIVKKAEFIGSAFVEKPVQKYSVPMRQDENGQTYDHYDYSVVKFVTDRLQSPFHGWTATWEKALHPHKFFEHVSHSAGCPCDSGRKYEGCCLQREGVIRPHLEVWFEVHPPEALPNGEFAGYGKHSGQVRFRDDGSS